MDTSQGSAFRSLMYEPKKLTSRQQSRQHPRIVRHGKNCVRHRAVLPPEEERQGAIPANPRQRRPVEQTPGPTSKDAQAGIEATRSAAASRLTTRHHPNNKPQRATLRGFSVTKI